MINDPDGPVKDWPRSVLACLQCIAEGLKDETVKVRWVRKNERGKPYGD